jgi:hypothetical protein
MFPFVVFIIGRTLVCCQLYFSNLCLYKIGEHAIIKSTLTRRGAFYGKNIKATAGYHGFHQRRG